MHGGDVSGKKEKFHANDPWKFHATGLGYEAATELGGSVGTSWSSNQEPDSRGAYQGLHRK